jgi:predicted RNA binding protein YcfA (HicA-like mRNA interferase family)
MLGKLRKLSGQEVVRLLSEQGFVQVRQRGSHIAMQRREERATITVIVPDYKELHTGTLRSIVRQSGLPRALFEST